ncbi:MAG: hypothetical protein GY937_10120 [bacterium]|nr:hypothetical protein [bacterium]
MTSRPRPDGEVLIKELVERSSFFRYAPGVLAGVFIACLVGGFATTGSERFELLFIAVVIAAVASPIVLRRHPRLQSAAMVFRFLVGIGMALAGLAALVFSVMLFKAGSFGILAGMILFPVGLTGLYLGGVMAFLPAVPPLPDAVENDAESY